MNERPLKNQLTVFGKFHFPPIPQTTIQLTQAFQTYDLMPSMVNWLDPTTNQVSPKLSLQRALDGIQIVFSDDRIDVAQSHFDASLPFSDFLSFAQTLLGCLSHLGLRYVRLAVIRELLLDEVPTATISSVSRRLLPKASAQPLEWTARWVDVEDGERDRFNVCCDVQKIQGMMISPKGAQITFDGIRLLFDISTTQHNIEPRYSNNNIEPVIQEMQRIVDQQRVKLEI